MKKVVSLLIVVVMLCTVALSFGENVSSPDVTFKTLYTNMVQAMKDSSGGSEEQLMVENATVWKISDTLAGFAFQGSDWQIFGEADMETGIILRLFCRLPYTKAGLLMTYMTAYVLSEEPTPSDFISNYVGDNSLLNGKPFPHYANTLDAGNESTLVYEFTRTGGYELADPENKCEMKQLIDQIQVF